MVQRPVGALEPLPLVSLRAGQVPARQDQPSPGLWVVVVGALRAAVVSPEGHEMVLDVLGAGDPVGEPDGLPSVCTVTALRSSKLRAARPDEVANLLSTRARRAEARATDLAWFDTRTRVHRRLQDLASRFGRQVPGGTAIALRLTQEELALMTGTARESVNRAMRSLIEKGIVKVHRRGRYVLSPPLRLVGSP